PESVERDDEAAGGESTSEQADGDRLPVLARGGGRRRRGRTGSFVARRGGARGLGRCGCRRRSRGLVLRRRGRFGWGRRPRWLDGRRGRRQGEDPAGTDEVRIPEGRAVRLGAGSVEVEHLNPAAGVTEALPGDARQRVAWGDGDGGRWCCARR